MEWMLAIIGGTVYGEEGVEVASLFLEEKSMFDL